MTNVLESNAPAGQQYEIQTTTQGTLQVSLAPGGGGGSTTVSPLVTTSAQCFWIMQGSTAGGGAAVQTDIPSGALATFAAALALATPGVPCTLFVGDGDYSAEGLQDFGAKGVPALTVISLNGNAGASQVGGGVTIPALNCDSLTLYGVALEGAGLTQTIEMYASYCTFGTTGGLTAGSANFDFCNIGGGPINVSTAILTNCRFLSDIGAITSVEGWDIDSNTASQLGNGPANGKFNSSTSVVLNSTPCKLMHDADTTVVLTDFDQVLVLNEFTAPRTLTVDITGASDTDALTVLVYADVAGGAPQNTLTVNPGATVLGRDNRTSFFTLAAPNVVQLYSEHAPTF